MRLFNQSTQATRCYSQIKSTGIAIYELLTSDEVAFAAHFHGDLTGRPVDAYRDEDGILWIEPAFIAAKPRPFPVESH